MPGTTGLLGAFRVRAAAPKSALVVVSAYDSARIVACAMALGISGYIPKSTPKAELIQSIHSVLEGEIYVPKRLHGRAATRRSSAEIQNLLRQLSCLTSQQLRVLDMICRRSRFMSPRSCESSASEAAPTQSSRFPVSN